MEFTVYKKFDPHWILANELHKCFKLVMKIVKAARKEGYTIIVVKEFESHYIIWY